MIYLTPYKQLIYEILQLFRLSPFPPQSLNSSCLLNAILSRPALEELTI